ncbi:MAG: ribosome silencing factor [Dehalococcoidia bacterium]|nr:ribosome silencing factor [Dehalococcoidia bacterium]
MDNEALTGMDKARRIVDIVSDKLAADIVLLDACGVCSFADYFVMASGESARQLQAIAEEVVHQLKQAGTYPLHREGTAESGWILLDYGDVIVHIFSEAERQIYRLDEMWRESRLVLRIG